MATPPATLFTFTVNGTAIKTLHDKLVAADILKLAAEEGAMPNKPEDYVLETADDNLQFKSEDWVDLQQHKAFITVPTGKTDVAALLP